MSEKGAIPDSSKMLHIYLHTLKQTYLRVLLELSINKYTYGTVPNSFYSLRGGLHYENLQVTSFSQPILSW